MLNISLDAFLAIQESSVENSLLSSVPHFLIGSFSFLESNLLSSLYIIDINPLSDVGLAKKINPNLKVAFYPIDSVLCITEAFQLHGVPFVSCQILEPEPLVFYLGNFPLCLYIQDSLQVSLLLDSIHLVLC